MTVTSGGSTTWAPGGGTLAINATASHQWTVHGASDGIEQLSASAQDDAYGETFTASDSAPLTVDSTAPSPSIECPVSGTAASLALAWSASDASGVQAYDVYVATDGGAFSPWVTSSGDTGRAFNGVPGHAYSFEVRATDPLGNASEFVSCGPVAIGFAPVVPPGPGSGGQPSPVPVLPAPAHLKISRVSSRGSALRVSGSVVKDATGSVTGSYALPGVRPARAHARVTHGRYLLVFDLSRRFRHASRGVMKLSYSGDRAHATQRLTRRLSRPQ
jgi:hypothetical protein